MTEVGVSLALRRKNDLLKRKKKKEEQRESSSQRKKVISSRRKKSQNNVNRNSSLQIFIEGSALYTLCLVLPSLLGILARFLTIFLENHSQATASACSYIPGLSKINFCQKFSNNAENNLEQGQQASFSDAIAPDAGLSDVAIVGFLSLSMAIIRLVLVHFLVPDYNQPKRMKALVRCKSIHLLSSQYTGNGTPKVETRRNVVLRDTDDNGNPNIEMLPPLPLLPDSKDNDNDTSQSKDDDHDFDFEPKSLFHKRRGSHRDDDNEDWGMHFDDQGSLLEDTNEEEEVIPPPAVSSGLISSSSAVSLQTLLHQATPMLDAPMSPRIRHNKSNVVSQQHQQQLQPDSVEVAIFTAPKFATAVFRLFYSSACCTIALYYFLDADFWPPAVGGTGNTKNCWDLSSVGAAVMDSDFDHHNTVLRRYFLLQASYHFHSGAFHIFTALLLWFVSSSKQHLQEEDNKFVFGFLPSGMITINNVKTLLQHCFAVCLVTFVYLFSSLRRLGTIAMFSFDFSSWSLHLLQLCINDSSQRISPKNIKRLHRFLVIPLFCYSRFYIFPFVIGYSAFEESQNWLKQLENMLVPGVARYVDGVFVISFCLIMIMNVVYFQRLLNHPHVSQALERWKQENLAPQ